MSLHPVHPVHLDDAGYHAPLPAPVLAPVIHLDTRREPTPLFDRQVAAFRAAEIENLATDLSAAVFNGESVKALTALLSLQPKLERAAAMEVATSFLAEGDLA